MRIEKRSISLLVHLAGRQRNDCIRCIFFSRFECTTAQCKKQDAKHKPRTLVAIDEGMILHEWMINASDASIQIAPLGSLGQIQKDTVLRTQTCNDMLWQHDP